METTKITFGHAARCLWTLDPTIHFLNHGSYGATPRSVQTIQQGWRDQLEAEPVRFMSDVLPVALDAARQRLATFLGATLENLVFVENATSGANAVLRSLHWQRGDKVVIANHGYPALKHTLHYFAERYGIEVVYANVPWPIRDAGEVESAYIDALVDGARLMVVDHIFSPLAVETPLPNIIAACKAIGTTLLVDGAHAPALLPLELDALAAQGVDWYVGNCHKWLCAPKGAGFLYAPEHAQRDLHPPVISNFYGEGFVREFSWTGTGDPTARLAVSAAIDFVTSLGVERYRQHLRALAAEATALLSEAWGAWGAGAGAPLSMCPAMVTIPLPQDWRASPEDAAALRAWLLNKHHIEVPIHVVNGRLWVRISAQVYNELSDYEALADAVLRYRANSLV